MEYAIVATEEDQMPFSRENEQWVRDEIQSVIGKALKGLRPPSGFRKAFYALREWGVLAGNFAFILALGVFALTQWNAANKRLADESSFEKGTEDRLKEIEKILNELQHPSPLQAFASMDPNTFAATLPQLRKQLERTTPRSVQPNDAAVHMVTQKLDQADDNAPGYWPTVAAMISFTSELRTGVVVDTSKLNNCIALGPGPMSHLTIAGNGYQCMVTLDQTDLGDSTITDAVVRFTRGPSRLSNVTFVNCLFLVSLPASPNRFAQSLARKLLVKTTEPSVMITIS